MRTTWTIWVRNGLGFDMYMDIYAQSVEEAIKIVNSQVGEEFYEIIGCIGCQAYQL